MYATAYLWSSEDKLHKVVLSFLPGSSRDQTQVSGSVAGFNSGPIHSALISSWLSRFSSKSLTSERLSISTKHTVTSFPNTRSSVTRQPCLHEVPSQAVSELWTSARCRGRGKDGDHAWELLEAFAGTLNG